MPANQEQLTEILADAVLDIEAGQHHALVINKTRDAILEAISDALPEELKLVKEVFAGQEQYTEGWNDCLGEVKEILK